MPKDKLHCREVKQSLGGKSALLCGDCPNYTVDFIIPQTGSEEEGRYEGCGKKGPHVTDDRL